MSSSKMSASSLGVKSSRAECAHARMVDDELSENREKTGRLICKECGAAFLNEKIASRDQRA